MMTDNDAGDQRTQWKTTDDNDNDDGRMNTTTKTTKKMENVGDEER